MSDTLVCLGNTPFDAKCWRPLGAFADSLWRHLSPPMFLRAHRVREPDDPVLRHILFMAAALASDAPGQTAWRTGLDRLSALSPAMSIEEVVALLGLPPALIDLLERCGVEPLDDADYRHLAQWSGLWGEEDSRRLQRLRERQALNSEVISAAARAPDDLYPMLADRTHKDLDVLLEVLPELIAALPFSPDNARSFLIDRLRHVNGDGLVDHIRSILGEIRKMGAFRAPPSFDDPHFCVITHPGLTARSLDITDSVRERILFERAFLVGVRLGAGSPGFRAFALLEALHASHRAPAGFLLNPLILDGEGDAADQTLADDIRDRLLGCVRVPVFLSPASGRPSALELQVMDRRHQPAEWN
jgi:hypothetical protein